MCWLEQKGDLTEDERKVLKIFERTFKCYIMENPEARRLREESTATEVEESS